MGMMQEPRRMSKAEIIGGLILLVVGLLGMYVAFVNLSG
jgi:hypothetical protein